MKKKKKKYDLTVIIVARNEGEEVPNTLNSLYETIGDNVEVILINDNSATDHWVDPPEHDNLTYIHQNVLNGGKYGLIEAIYSAVEIMQADKFFWCNARCRFTKGWAEDFIKALKQEPETIFTPIMAVLSYDQTDIDKAKLVYGSAIVREREDRQFRFYQTKHITNKKDKCVAHMGGMGITREWFLKLGGFDPLQTRGAMNAFIALKCWKAGGAVKCLDTVIGNIFRTEGSYPVTEGSTIFNHAALGYIIGGPSEGLRVLHGLKKVKGYGLAKVAFVNNLIQLKFERERIMKMKKREITSLLT